MENKSFCSLLTQLVIVLRSVHEAGSVLCKMALYRFFYWLLQSRRLCKNSLPKQSQFPLKNILILKPRNHQYATEQATNIPHGTESSTHNITSRYFKNLFPRILPGSSQQQPSKTHANRYPRRLLMRDVIKSFTVYMQKN